MQLATYSPAQAGITGSLPINSTWTAPVPIKTRQLLVNIQELVTELLAASRNGDAPAVSALSATLRELDPKNRIGYLNEAATLRNRKEFDQAKALAVQALETCPPHYSIYDTLGSICNNQRQYKEAATHYAHFVGLVPRLPAGYVKHATVLARDGQFREAVDIVSQAQQLFPDNISVHNAEAYVHLLRGDYQGAIASHRRALAIDPKDKTARIWLARIYINLVQIPQAEPILHDLLADYPTDPEILTKLDHCTNSRGALQESEKKISELQSLETHSPFDDLAVGDMLWQSKGPHEALSRYKAAAEKQGHTADTLGRLVQALLATRDFQLAGTYWNELLNTTSTARLESLIGIHRAANGLQESAILGNMLASTGETLKREIFGPGSGFDGIRSIALVGGSNTLMNFGWGPAFIRSMNALTDIKVVNYGLGGHSSLYGLMKVMEESFFDDHDLTIFEYTLNDIYLNQISTFDVEMVAGVVREVCRRAHSAGKKVAFLLLTGESNLEKAICSDCVVTRAYEQEARRGEMVVVSASQLLSAISPDFRPGACVDDLHYNGMTGRSFADALIKAISSGKSTAGQDDLEAGPIAAVDFSTLRIVPASELVYSGPHQEIAFQNRAIEGRFMRLETESSFSYRMKGQLIGLMINSSVDTGFIKICFGHETIVKGVFASRRTDDESKSRVIFRQLNRILKSEDIDTLTVTPRMSESDLANYPVDRTAYQSTPLVPLSRQKLDIISLLVVDS